MLHIALLNNRINNKQFNKTLSVLGSVCPWTTSYPVWLRSANILTCLWIYLARISQIHKLKLRKSPHPHSRILPVKLILSHLVKTFSTFYETSRPINFITTVLHIYQPSGRLMNNTSVYLISVWLILISNFHLRLGHPNCFSSACFSTKVPTPLYTLLYTSQFTLLSFYLKMADTNGGNMLYSENECTVFFVLFSVW